MILHYHKLHDNAIAPVKGTPDSACFDIAACIQDPEGITIQPGKIVLVPTGLVFNCGPDRRVYIELYPRSSTSVKRGLLLANSTGMIDHDYRDEMMIPLLNFTDESVTIQHGDRLAQILPSLREECTFFEAAEHPGPHGERTGGFGSTGKTTKDLN